MIENEEVLGINLRIGRLRIIIEQTKTIIIKI